MYLFSCTSFILKSVYLYSQQQKCIAYVKKENLYKAFKKSLKWCNRKPDRLSQISLPFRSQSQKGKKYVNNCEGPQKTTGWWLTAGIFYLIFFVTQWSLSQSVTRLTHRDRQEFTHITNLKSPAKLQQEECTLTVGESQTTLRL